MREQTPIRRAPFVVPTPPKPKKLPPSTTQQVLAQIDSFVRAYDIGGLLGFWEFLDRRLFAHLDAHHAREMHKMKVALLRCVPFFFSLVGRDLRRTLLIC